MLSLDFSASDLNLDENVAKTRRASMFGELRGQVESMVAASCLSDAAKGRYFAKFADRLSAVAQ